MSLGVGFGVGFYVGLGMWLEYFDCGILLRMASVDELEGILLNSSVLVVALGVLMTLKTRKDRFLKGWSK